MTIKTKLLLLLVTSAMLNIGCVPVKPATHKNIWEKTNNFVENEFFTAEISPYYDNSVAAYNPLWARASIGYNGFKLTIKSKTDKNLELNWNKTLQIFNGETLNGFMTLGSVYDKRNDPVPPSIIFPNSTLSKIIWPNDLVKYERGDVSGDYAAKWRNKSMRLGENGVYLTVVSDGKEINEKLTMKYLRVRK